MSWLTSKVLGWTALALGLALMATSVVLTVVVKDRDAKVAIIALRDETIRQRDGTIRTMRKDTSGLQATDATDAARSAVVCSEDVTAAFARGKSLGQAICTARTGSPQ